MYLFMIYSGTCTSVKEINFLMKQPVLFWSDDIEKMEEQRRWLDNEVGKVVEQRRQVEELEEVSQGQSSERS